MKVKRYHTGQQVVSKLKEQRSRMLSPEEAASAAGAKYSILGDAATRVGQQLNLAGQAAQKEDERLLAQEDAIAEKLAMEEIKLRTTEWENNPNYKDQSQADGTPTASKMLEDMEGIIKFGGEQLQNIQDPDRRANAEKLFAVTSEAARVQARTHVNNKRDKWNEQGKFDLREIMYLSQDWNGYRAINQELVDDGSITQKQYQAAENRVEVKQKENFVYAELDKYEERIAAGQGKQVLADVLANPNEDKDVQRAIVAGVKAQTTNYNLIEEKASDSLVAGWMREVDKALNSIANDGAVIDVDSLFNSMIGSGLDPIKSATLTNQVSAAMRGRTKKDDGFTLFKAQVSTGEPMPDTPANQAHADRWVQAQVESRPDERSIDVEIESYKSIGFVGGKWQNRLKNASSDQQVAEAAEFWSAIHDNPYRYVEDGVSGEKAGIYEMVTRRAKEGGMPWIDAARDVADITKMDENRKELRKQQWVDGDSDTKATDFYRYLISSEAYDKSMIPLYTGLNNINHKENILRYRMYLQDGFTLTGNWADAQAHADEVFKASHVVTNINGDLEMQVGGIPNVFPSGAQVDLSPLRTKFVEGISGQQVMFTAPDGDTKLGIIDSTDGLTLDDPKQVLGEYIYTVSMNGNRVINPKTGQQLQVSFDNNDLYELQVSQSAKTSEKVFRQDQANLQAQIEKLAGEVEFYKKAGADYSAQEKLMRGKEQLMMDKERQRRIETEGMPGF